MVSFWIRMQRSEASTTARGADLVIVRGRTIWCRSGDETEENRGPFGRSRRRAELSREHSVFFTLNIFTNTWQYIAPAVVLITLKEFMYLHTYYTAYWYWKLPKPKLNEWLYKSCNLQTIQSWGRAAGRQELSQRLFFILCGHWL